jgi:mono/diheme cytochrome c family protein
MPPFAQQLSDADVAAVVSYIRHAWSNDAKPVMERDVAAYRHTPVE